MTNHSVWSQFVTRAMSFKASPLVSLFLTDAQFQAYRQSMTFSSSLKIISLLQFPLSSSVYHCLTHGHLEFRISNENLFIANIQMRIILLSHQFDFHTVESSCFLSHYKCTKKMPNSKGPSPRKNCHFAERTSDRCFSGHYYFNLFKFRLYLSALSS